jgi:hypothetical protein
MTLPVDQCAVLSDTHGMAASSAAWEEIEERTGPVSARTDV